MSKSLKISSLSPHLFWDVNAGQLDPEKNKKLIIQRTLDYGLIDDWKMVREYYGIQMIAETARMIRDLDLRSAAYIALLANIPLEEFACYTTKRSTPKHWGF